MTAKSTGWMVHGVRNMAAIQAGAVYTWNKVLASGMNERAELVLQLEKQQKTARLEERLGIQTSM